MKRILLLLCLLVFQLSYPNAYLGRGFSGNDTLTVKKPVPVKAVPAATTVSTSFLDKIEEKFPDENRPTRPHSINNLEPEFNWQYPLGSGYRVVNREEKEYGIPPKKAVPINNYYLTGVEHEINHNWLLRNFPYYYNLPLVYKQDWVDLRSQVLNDWVDGKLSSSSPAMKFLDEEYLFMRYGNYTVNMQYILPGGIRGASHEYDFKNENRFR